MNSKNLFWGKSDSLCKEFSGLNVIFWKLNLNPLKIIDISPGIFPLLGYDPSVVKNNPSKLFSSVVPEDIEKIFLARKKLKRGNSTEIVIRLNTSSGMKWIKTMAIPEQKKKGQIIVSAISFDVTAENNDLHLAKKENQILRINQKRSQRKIDQTLTNINSLISSMVGLVKISFLNANPEKLKDHLHIIFDSLKKMDFFTRQYIDEEKVQFYTPQPVTFNFRDSILHSWGAIEKKNKNSVHLKIHDHAVDSLSLDREFLQIIFKNLFNHLLKDADKTRNIEITGFVETGELSVVVTHDGRKMDTDDLKVFYEDDRENHTSFLPGLSLIKMAVMKMEGYIMVGEGLNGGEEIIFRFPYTAEKENGEPRKVRKKAGFIGQG